MPFLSKKGCFDRYFVREDASCRVYLFPELHILTLLLCIFNHDKAQEFWAWPDGRRASVFELFRCLSCNF